MSVVDLPSAPADRSIVQEGRSGRLIRAMAVDLQELPERPRSETAKLVRWGAALVLVLFGIFGLWAATVPLASAVIAPGVVKVLSRHRAVQHLEGGIVKAILVQEGEQAERGQLLARLDTTQIEANLGVLETKLFADLATVARLEAEQAGAAEIAFPDELQNNTTSREARSAMAAQLSEFAARATSLQGERKLIDQQIAQLEDAIRGFQSGSEGLARQLSYLQEEIKDSDFLLAKGLARKPRVLALKRTQADVEARIAANASSLAQSRGKIAELEDRRRQTSYAWLEDIAKQSHATRERISDTRYRIAAAQDMLRRSEIRAPEAGTIVGLNTRSLNAVLNPRETLLDIVPTQDRLVVEGEVKPSDRNEVRLGQPARVRVLAFNSRRTPMFIGAVTMVTADALVDPRSGKPFYKAEVDLRQTPELGPYFASLQPGMPVEIFVETGHRTFAEYLLEPLMLRVRRAFRES
ncbi:MAG: HlyD family type I secretion periplasmic adaptor subunit [Bosea sp.]|uniref:HlyD family type I secretion periplasmic adaptor subunit n=1 Tax=unclassified Bosea (in: a-proteobacteria) TaxID=2653178 RepID=UPI000AF311E9|nr:MULTISPECIES: HlyD family type I secretion periplasmic adaptor subunit [unclassified Bosea (in: a-proteobacteria)]MBN9458094.1 HlyD family type I secretion periplasmic adaptor subunit [Bosea sp. (in: a-proteobacteria)]